MHKITLGPLTIVAEHIIWISVDIRSISRPNWGQEFISRIYALTFGMLIGFSVFKLKITL